MRYVLASIVLLISIAAKAEEPVGQKQIENLTKVIETLRDENSKLMRRLELLQRRFDMLDGPRRLKDQRSSGSPEYDLSRRVGGRWVIEPQTQVPVYARTEWIVRRFGKSIVMEAIRINGKPVPVGSVFYPAQGTLDAQGQPIPDQNGGRLLRVPVAWATDPLRYSLQRFCV